jgi:nitronate monooxygenase
LPDLKPHRRSALCDRLGIELPIIQAPMAGVQGSALAVAVSNAGGLGSLPCALLMPDAIRGDISAITAHTSQPYNVNFFCHTAPVADAGREAWRPIIISSATTVDEARWLEAHGVDVIVAQGLEAGGHRGHFLSDDLTLQAGTFALLPQILRAVRVPVVAAGGIADAAGVAAAMALGADGVQIGTSYLLCPEATTSAVHRAALKSESARHTAVTNVLTGRPARGIVNRLIASVGPMSATVPPFPLAAAAVGPLRAKAEGQGNGDYSSLWSGQNASGCREVPAADLTRQLAERL